MIPPEWIELAEARIRPHIVETPLTWDAEHEIYVKWENHQVTGSFKARGALTKVLSLSEAEREAGIVAVSAGNHGQGVALAGRLVGAAVEVFVPEHAPPSKVEAMKRLGAEIRVVEGGYGAAESAGRAYALARHNTFVSPYNDVQVIAGQATLALECLRQLDRAAASGPAGPASPNCWIVPVGGAGLISGCGAVLSRRSSPTRLVGVQAAASAFAHSLFHRHTQEGIADDPTLAEGLSGEVEATSVTIPLMQKYLQDFVLVSEDEIADAIALAQHEYDEKIEGSGAAALAAVASGLVQVRPALVVITGGNIAPELHRSIVDQHRSAAWN